jgi:hypothetical protein
MIGLMALAVIGFPNCRAIGSTTVRKADPTILLRGVFYCPALKRRSMKLFMGFIGDDYSILKSISSF